MPKPSVVMPQPMLDEIDDRRHSTTDRSKWIRQAIAARLEAEDSDEWHEPEEWSGNDLKRNSPPGGS